MLTLWLCGLTILKASEPNNLVASLNEAFIDAVRKETPPPCLVARNLAIFHVAMHRAERSAKNNSQKAIAVVWAADAIFYHFFPSQSAAREALRAQCLTPGNDVAEAHHARELGITVANGILRERQNDGATTTVPYVPNDKPGQWRRTEPALRPPELPHWGNVRPFALEKAGQFRPPPPPELNSEAYAQAVAEVRELGGKSSDTRTEQQTLIARFWSDFSYTSTPPGHWNMVACALVRNQEWEVEKSAQLFAALNVAMADAGIAVWEAKYYYNLWRPCTAIRRAAEDGNGFTQPDGEWRSLLATPPHPEYVSGHAGFSGAAVEVLEHFFAKEKPRIKAQSDTLPAEVREFSSFAACANEICMSRVYGGIHYRFSGQRGLEVGRKTGRWVLDHLASTIEQTSRSK